MAGAFDSYSDALARLGRAKAPPVLYRGEDGSGDPPYFGTFGHFDAHGAVQPALTDPSHDYGGNLPISQQPQIKVPDPWTSYTG
jgi:hypothetical protein